MLCSFRVVKLCQILIFPDNHLAVSLLFTCNGSFCRNVLQCYQDEFFGNESTNGQVFIASVVDQEATENLDIELISNLSNTVQNSSECEVKARQLICLYLFGLLLIMELFTSDRGAVYDHK